LDRITNPEFKFDVKELEEKKQKLEEIDIKIKTVENQKLIQNELDEKKFNLYMRLVVGAGLIFVAYKSYRFFSKVN